MPIILKATVIFFLECSGYTMDGIAVNITKNTWSWLIKDFREIKFVFLTYTQN